MKKVICFLAMVLIAGTITAQVQTFEKAADYNDFIIGEQTKIGMTIKEFYALFQTSTDTVRMHEARNAIVTQAELSISVLKKAGSFKNDTALKNNALRLFDYYSSIASNEFKRVVHLLFGTDKSSDATTKELTELVTSVTKRENVLDDNFQKAQRAFAAKNNIELTENSFKINE